MTKEHPITPPPELVREWATINGTSYEDLSALYQNIATQAARWGSDQELEACCEWFLLEGWHPDHPNKLRAARRPKPLNLKEQALQALAHLENGAHCSMDTTESAHYIRRALESLHD
jgi:hypothetical protein